MSDKILWIDGYLLTQSMSTAGLLIEFDDMDAPCWVPASQTHVQLDEPGTYGSGVFGLPDFVANSRVTVAEAHESDRQHAADRADAAERARKAAVEAERGAKNNQRQSQFGFKF